MKNYLWTLLCLPSLAFAQTSETVEGVKFSDRLTWSQVKDEARRQNKYIFVDCYASWCGPCKKMDKEIYTQPQVGELLNERFINIKIQIDSTSHDDSKVQARY